MNLLKVYTFYTCVSTIQLASSAQASCSLPYIWSICSKLLRVWLTFEQTGVCKQIDVSNANWKEKERKKN